MTILELKEIGDYAILEEIGKGGMGVVYRAEDRALKRPVALKVLEPRLLEDAGARTRFQQEIKTAVGIEHPHVIPVYSAGYENGHFFLAMRFVDGPDLWRLVHKGGPLPEVRAMRLVGQIASALHFLHGQSIVHRDVKPQNVLVWHADRTEEHAFLTDFGIAKALDDTVGLTRFGALGTPGYMAPELVVGQAASPAADQYSLACLAYEVLSGELPFPEGVDGEDEPLPLWARAPRVSSRVRETIERALSSEPGDRFPDIRAFVMGDQALQEAFETSRQISNTLRSKRTQSEIVTGLYADQGLSIERIAEITDLERSEVLRLRRRAARRSIVGE
jgi:serine/threonine-protein kinase